MSNQKGNLYLLIIFLVILIGVNFLAWQKIGNSNNIIKNKETVNQIQTKGLELIENECTNYLDNFSYNLPEEWQPYYNEKYGFEINHPEEFEGKKVKIQEVDFNGNMDFSSKKKEDKVSNDAYFTFGNNYKTAKHIIDFNVFVKEKVAGDNKTYQVESSLFAIVIHPNESNLSFEDFMSQEILNMYEGIEEQRVVKINGVEGYRIITPAIHSLPLSIIYYLPSKDNKTIISIGAPIQLFHEIRPTLYDFELSKFLESYPQYQEEIRTIKNRLKINAGDRYLEKFMGNNHDYKKFIERLNLEHTKKELNKRLMFEKIVYSFKFTE